MAVTGTPKVRDHARRAWRVSARVGLHEIVVVTGNHFIIDAVFGAIVSFAGLGIAWLLHLYGGTASARVVRRVRPGAAPDAASGERRAASGSEHSQ